MNKLGTILTQIILVAGLSQGVEATAQNRENTQRKVDLTLASKSPLISQGSSEFSHSFISQINLEIEYCNRKGGLKEHIALLSKMKDSLGKIIHLEESRLKPFIEGMPIKDDIELIILSDKFQSDVDAVIASRKKHGLQYGVWYLNDKKSSKSIRT